MESVQRDGMDRRVDDRLWSGIVEVARRKKNEKMRGEGVESRVRSGGMKAFIILSCFLTININQTNSECLLQNNIYNRSISYLLFIITNISQITVSVF